MKHIKLKNIRLSSFKGVKSQEVTFHETVTSILGDNGTGKTTVFDAFLWLLFGKDSSDRSEFEIKHISQNGNGTPRQAEVQATLSVDGSPITFKRTLREKWVRKRGALHVEFAGNETLFQVDDVPLSMKEYQDKVAELCQEHTFRLITNPLYFSSMKWQAQREILFEMASQRIDDASLISQNKDYEALLDRLSGKTLEDFKKQLQAAKRRIKEELELIPARMDEVQRNMPNKEDFPLLRRQLTDLDQHIASADEQLADQSKITKKELEEKQQLLKQLHQAQDSLSRQQEQIRKSQQEKFREHQDHREQLQATIKSLKNKIVRVLMDIQELKQSQQTALKDRETLRESWYNRQQEQLAIDPEGFVCPTCRRNLEATDVEAKTLELQEHFNLRKAEALALIQARGQQFTDKLQRIEESLALMEKDKKQWEAEFKDLNKQLEALPEDNHEPTSEQDLDQLDALQKEVDRLRQAYDTPLPMHNDLNQIKQHRETLQQQRSDLLTRLSKQEIIEKSQQRSAELALTQQTLAQELADLEQDEFTMEAYERARMQALEEQVNGLFSLVKFRLFETQVNGQQIPTCVATYRRVPFGDLNTAARINCGLDIINAICQNRQVCAPVFVDHSEGVTALHTTLGQQIRLSVSPTHKTLEIINH